MDAPPVTRNACWGGLFRPLPVAAEVHARLRRHRQCHHVANLSAVIGAAVILAPRAFLRVADQVGASDMVMMANFGATEAAEEPFRAIRVDTGARAVERLVINTGHRVAGL